MHCILMVSSSLEFFSFSGAKPCHAALSQSRLYHFHLRRYMMLVMRLSDWKSEASWTINWIASD